MQAIKYLDISGHTYNSSKRMRRQEKKKTSKEKSVTRLLFVIYINDLPEHVVSQIHPFADDTKLLKKVRTQNDSVLLQNDMDDMQNWSNT